MINNSLNKNLQVVELDFNLSIEKYKILKSEELIARIGKSAWNQLGNTVLFYVLKLFIKLCKNYDC